MENKTIRVWDKICTACANCPLCQCTENDSVIPDIICSYTGKSVFGYYCTTEIAPDCPFSKSLSKEDIESCGFPLVQTDYEQLHLAFIINENAFITLDYFNKVKIFRLLKDSKEVLFEGTINNLPEFKLILKMLNIK